jgi:hypothetical protein
MSALVHPAPSLPAMSPQAIERIRDLESWSLARAQTVMTTHHLIHGGMYARTIRIPAGVLLTGAEIKLATLVVFNGHAKVATDGEVLELQGYHVLAASKGRKQAFIALADTDLTMVFPTRATTVEEAEDQFTDEASRLFSRSMPNVVVITGE